MRGGREYAERGKLWPCLKQACNFLTRSSLASMSKMYRLSTTLSEDLSNLLCLATHSPCWQQKGTPNTHLSITFECANGIIGRVTPEVSGSLYVLDLSGPMADVWKTVASSRCVMFVEAVLSVSCRRGRGEWKVTKPSYILSTKPEKTRSAAFKVATSSRKFRFHPAFYLNDRL